MSFFSASVFLFRGHFQDGREHECVTRKKKTKQNWVTGYRQFRRIDQSSEFIKMKGCRPRGNHGPSPCPHVLLGMCHFLFN